MIFDLSDEEISGQRFVSSFTKINLKVSPRNFIFKLIIAAGSGDGSSGGRDQRVVGSNLAKILACPFPCYLVKMVLKKVLHVWSESKG